MFIRGIWGKLTSFIFWNFEISLVSLGRFQNFKKVNSVNLSQISLLNMWLLSANIPLGSIFLGNMYFIAKPVYWNKRKQPLKNIPQNRCSYRASKILEKYLWKSSCLCLVFKDFVKIESCFFIYFLNSGTAIFKERLFFLNEKSNVFEMKNRKF